MNFDEAFQSLLDGNYVTRNTWAQTGEYLALLPGMLYIWKLNPAVPSQSAGAWLALVADIQADDWSVL